MRRAFLTPPGEAPMPLTGELARFGRDPGCELPVRDAKISRWHSMFTRRGLSWWVLDLGSSYGTFVRRDRAWLPRTVEPQLLHHGDQFDLNARATFTLERREDDPLELPLAAAVAERPDDPARWRVYADRLLEQGDQRGERIATDRRSCPGLDDHWRSLAGASSLEWAFGHVRRMTLDSRGDFHHFVRLLRGLLWLPATEFVVELKLQWPTDPDEDEDQRRGQLARVLENTRLPALRSLIIDPPLDATLPHSPHLI